ncbi:MAG: phosphoribosylamine--glycine ligase [Candidatus Moranbacteria bacterium]|nr:phosphoribosylamine--glycine ligase [Candidatus Moranbacteria bacterium]
MDENRSYRNILIIDRATRGDALAWRIAQYPWIAKVKVVPGNGGTRLRKEREKMIWIQGKRKSDNAFVPKIESIPIHQGNEGHLSSYVTQLAAFAEVGSTSMTIVGPIYPLSAGIVDSFAARRMEDRIFGPSRAAAMIETSKVFAKEIMMRTGIKTAPYKTYRTYKAAEKHILKIGVPCVVKADGLTLGKGSHVCLTLEEALKRLREIKVKKVHGNAGKTVIIERYIPGLEFSVTAFCDWNGKEASFVMLPATQDHKEIGDGNLGENTGGMGIICPVPWVTDEIMNRVGKDIILPMLNALAELGTPFKGCLNPNIILGSEGSLHVADWNARLGDPETPAFMRLWKDGDITKVFRACAEGRLSGAVSEIRLSDEHVACVMLASKGYPGPYEKGFHITGIEKAESIPGVVVFHGRDVYESRTVSEKPRLLTDGGRVLCVTATGATLQDAVSKAYAAVDLIHFKGKTYRHDIGAQALEWMRQH